MPGMREKLCDEEGFPRADIDIPNIMAMRGRVHCLTNDKKAKHKVLEQGLHELHAMY